jgi:hypothetical protein
MLVLRRQSYNKKKKAAKEAAQQKEPAATAATDAGNTEQESLVSAPEQEATVLTGADHESNNIDYRGDSRVR